MFALPFHSPKADSILNNQSEKAVDQHQAVSKIMNLTLFPFSSGEKYLLKCIVMLGTNIPSVKKIFEFFFLFKHQKIDI